MSFKLAIFIYLTKLKSCFKRFQSFFKKFFILIRKCCTFI